MSIFSRLESLMDSTYPITAFSNASYFIYHEIGDVNWVGFYFYDPMTDKLILGPFQGKPACVEIGRGKGVCGYAFEKASPVVVPDVSSFRGHIACDSDSRSEIVLPIKVKGNVVALLDIDSTSIGRFSAEDTETLEKLSLIIGNYAEKVYPFVFLRTRG